MDEYSILRKKQKKNAFAATALLISIAIALLFMVGFVLVLGKVGDADLIATNEDGKNVTLTSSDAQACSGLVKEVIFNNNLRDIKDAAVSYFTNERLPKKVGEKVTISLEEMQNKKLILNVVDSTGASCSAKKTYVEVTKEKNEYVMKIFLSCTDMEDYILVHLGCYDYCKDNVCEKQDENGVTEFEYEYRKTVGCIMSKWSSWGNWKTTREKTSNLKKEDIKIETSTKTTTDVKDPIKDPATYNCDKYEGYKLVGDKCVKETTIVDTIDATPSEFSYNCDKYEGYSLVGDKCVKETTTIETIDAEENPTTYSCREGFELNKDNKCERTVTKTEVIDAKEEAATYTCPKGYKRDAITYTVKAGDTLASIAKANNIELETLKEVNKLTSDTVTVGQKLEIPAIYQTKCYKMVDKKDTKDAEPSCPKDYDLTKDNKCIKKTENKITVAAEPVYDTRQKKVESACWELECSLKPVFVCDETFCGTRDERSCDRVWTTCTSYEEEEYIKDYSCPDNTYTLNSKHECVKTETKTETAETIYTCSKDYTLTADHKCVKEYQEKEEVDANKNTPSYSCTEGYTLDDTKCVREYEEQETEDAIENPKTYYCKDGYTLTEDNKCTREVTEKDEQEPDQVEGGYVCPSEYTQIDEKTCEKKTIEKDEQPATQNEDTYTCIIGYELTKDNKCTKTTTEEVKTTYYRYATRTCEGGSTDTQWSTSKNDKDLINDGYKLTGNKREIIIK